MSSATIRPAYSKWPEYNRRLRDVVAAMTDEQLAMRPSPERWPIWATVGHTACQRVFWLCDFAGEPGAETTPFTNAGYNCPGDDDLEHVLGAEAARRRRSTRPSASSRAAWTDGPWTCSTRSPSRRSGTTDWVHTRGSVIQRVFSHDIYHCAELNETLGRRGAAADRLWA